MLARLCLVSLALLVGIGSATADDPPTDKLNKKIERIPLTATDGTAFDATSLANKKAVVVVFLSFDCPVSTSYSTTLNELSTQYAARGVAFVGVVPSEESLDTIKKHAAEYKLAFPIYADPKLAGADALKATTVPEAFVLDRNFVLRYRGRIDNAYSARLKKNHTVTSHDLRDAIDWILAGLDIKTPATKAIGCPIGRRELTAKPGAAPITYHKDVLPILQTNCQSCHRAGQVGPFALMTYRQAVNWAEDIKDYTASRKMPPWKPSGGVEFSNDRHMSDKDIATLAAWLDAGCPEGNPKDAPPPAKFSEEWQLGPPDLVLSVPEEFHVGATGRDLFRCFVFPTNFKDDRYIVGYEVRPGNPRVVHHTLQFTDTSGRARELQEQEQKSKRRPGAADTGPGYSVGMGIGFLPTPDPKRGGLLSSAGIGGWAPGQLPGRTPEGTGFLLPAGADIVIQTHYHRTGKPETDRLKLGLYFAKKPVEKVFQTVNVGPQPSNPRQILGLDKPVFEIPAGADSHKITGSAWLSADATVYSVLPHMHLIGRSVKLTMTPPDGQTVTIIDIKDWDYNWQETYWFKTPIKAKAGTRFDIEGLYNNSLSNPHNPTNPPRTVRFGEQTTNEMLFGFFGVTPEGTGRVRMFRTDPKTTKK